MNAQLTLFGHEAPRFAADFASIRRQELSGNAWIELCPGWLEGHWQVFDRVLTGTEWQHDHRQMYDRIVAVPRLTARLPEHGPVLPIIDAMCSALCARYGEHLDQISAAYYRSGSDSVAPHGDRVGRERQDCVVAIVSLGEPRRFLLKRASGGPSEVFALGGGDLIVMGGQCQRNWLHSVPKAKNAGPRISLQFRPAANSHSNNRLRYAPP